MKTAWLPMACNPANNQYVCSTDGKYGLVGFHLVQKISNHQEWIWASFEHVANAPDCADLHQTPPAPFTSWNFFNNEYYPCVSGSCTPTDCQPTCNLYQAQGPSNVCRVTPIAQDDTQSSGGPLVVQLNASVHSLLQNPKLTALKNYNLVGTLWFKPGLTAPPPLGSNNPPNGQIFIGSTALANTTMETYLQQTNCYSCHVTASFTFTYNHPGRRNPTSSRRRPTSATSSPSSKGPREPATRAPRRTAPRRRWHCRRATAANDRARMTGIAGGNSGSVRPAKMAVPLPAFTIAS